MNSHYLDEELKTYSAGNIYPFHMPGHKRQDMGIERPERIDITEIEGFDNLHHAEGILKEAQERMASVFGSDRSFFLVNGSTAGLLTAVFAAVPKGGRILIARNCHKAVYNAISLRELSAVYIYPQFTELGIQGSIQPEQVRNALDQNPDIQAVLLTSPTYDGVVSDVEKIAGIVHERGIPLIVDEAHGAHFGFSEGFPVKALSLGADVVIESMHKTLPAYTQTAALHLQGNRVSEEKIKKYLAIFQSSSPSYIFMAGLDRCSRLMQTEGRELLDRLSVKLNDFYRKVSLLNYLEVMLPGKEQSGIWAKDPSKILIFCHKTGISGQILYQRLLYEYGLQLEMASGHYVTALTSLMDTEDGFDRLAEALMDLDEQLAKTAADTEDERVMQTQKDMSAVWRQQMERLYRPVEKQMEIVQAEEAEKCRILLSNAAGKISGEFVYLYPPGIPFLVPGEVISEEFPIHIRRLMQEGFEVQGPEDWSLAYIKVCAERENM